MADTTEGGWIGVDFDSTLAEYHGWNEGVLGPPVPAMLERVKAWLAQGIEVRILTARVSCARDYPWLVDEQRRLIEAWCLEHLGRELVVTCEKDFRMRELWDDRAVRVEVNTGRRIC